MSQDAFSAEGAHAWRRKAAPAQASALSAVTTLAWRAMLKIKHVPFQLFDVVITPIMFTLLFTFVFGGALLGLAGVVAAGLLTLRPGADTDILLFALVVVVIGGLGSLQGAAVGSAIIGLVDAFSKAWVPELSSFAVFAPMAIVLMFRPAGLFGRART